MTLYLGAPVWGLKKWVGNFFPARSQQRDFLKLYSQRLNTVEGNTTFYSLPSQATLARWLADTPPGFKFCLKFPKTISHQRRLREARNDTDAFLDCLDRLGDRAGPAFLQLPPNFGLQALPALLQYLQFLPDQFQYAVEVRHPDFFSQPGEQALDEALSRHNVARCVFDTRGLRRAAPELNEATRQALERKPSLPVRFTRTASFGFVRFVGHPHLSENADLLDEWAGHVSGWLRGGYPVYFFCHVPEDVDAPGLCRHFHNRVSARVSVPALGAWKSNDTQYSQGALI